MLPPLALHLNPLEHVVNSHLFAGYGGALEDFGHSLAHWGLNKLSVLFIVAGAITTAIFLWRARQVRHEVVPGRFGSFIEASMLFVRDQMTRPFMGEEGDRFLPIIWTFFFFILVCNLLGMVPFLDYLGHGGNTPTGTFFLTLALAICSFFIYHGIGLKKHGPIHYVKSLFPKVPLALLPLMVVVELISHLIRPFALAVRLFANMLAGHTLIATILGFTLVWVNWLHWGAGISLVSFVTAVALTFLELLVAVIQAFIFAFLTTVYLAGAFHPEH
jgi:F-type H+-transporting ATPase subunit a